MTLTFSKYHGTGNDFVVIDAPEPFDAPLVTHICDRHRGVGADGLLLVSPHPHADARMIVQNADGSRPEMCGNGLRCVALHVARQNCTAPMSTTLIIQTDDGPKDCFVELDPMNPEARVTIRLGSLTTPLRHSLVLDNRTVELLTTSAGNPHAVILNPAADLDFEAIAPRIVNHPDFPEGINVTFATAINHKTVHARVWERGVGPTLACGTAACAVASILVHENLAKTDIPIPVGLPGGLLYITLATDNTATLTGPARHVFDGTLMPI